MRLCLPKELGKATERGACFGQRYEAIRSVVRSGAGARTCDARPKTLTLRRKVLNQVVAPARFLPPEYESNNIYEMASQIVSRIRMKCT